MKVQNSKNEFRYGHEWSSLPMEDSNFNDDLVSQMDIYLYEYKDKYDSSTFLSFICICTRCRLRSKKKHGFIPAAWTILYICVARRVAITGRKYVQTRYLNQLRHTKLKMTFPSSFISRTGFLYLLRRTRVRISCHADPLKSLKLLREISFQRWPRIFQRNDFSILFLILFKT